MIDLFAITNTVFYSGITAAVVVMGAGTTIGITFANFRNGKKSQTDTNATEAIAGAQALIDIRDKQIADQKEEQKARDAKYETEITELREKHLQSEKAISNLQGQINIIKDIPLQSIDKSLKDILLAIVDNGVIANNNAGVAQADTGRAARVLKAKDK